MSLNLKVNLLNSISAFVYHKKKNEIVRLMNEFAAKQWMIQEELLAKCDELTRKILIYSYQNVPYYRKVICKKGFDIYDFNLSKDWLRLPLLGKKELGDHFDELKSESTYNRKSYMNHTGGSTGNPVTFLTDLVQAKRMTAWLCLAYSWAGWQPGETRLELWGNKEQRLPLTLWDRVRASLSGTFSLPVYEYSESTMVQWIQVIEKLKPTIIYGYPSVLSDFAKWIDAEKRQVFGIKGVFSSAEVLYPEQRAVIEKAFSSKVYNQYGSREAPCIACECPDGGMHLFVDFNRIEFIDLNDGVDGYKEIIVTPLYNYVQPLIRYRLGDTGRPIKSSCSCGRGYPLMELNMARSRDVIIGPNGKTFFPGFFTRLMDGKKSIRAFQFVQNQVDWIELNIEFSGANDVAGYRQQLEREIKPLLSKKMGNIQFTINVVNKIDRTLAGKHRYVISKIKNGA